MTESLGAYGGIWCDYVSRGLMLWFNSTLIPKPTSLMSRSTHARAILGDDLLAKLNSSKTLVIGAGGIGCELCMSPLAFAPRRYFIFIRSICSEEPRSFGIQ
jgi:hypothetical protein